MWAIFDLHVILPTGYNSYVKLYIKIVLESNRLCKDTSCKCEKYTIYRKISLHNIL